MRTELEQQLQKSAEFLQQRLEKQAQNPLEGFEELLDNIPDEAKTALRNALIGGLIGGGGGAYAGGPDNRLKGLLTGAGLGALAGGGATLGSQLLSGQVSFPGERPGPTSLVGRGAGALTGAMASHPGLTAGGILGGAGAYLKGPRTSKIREELHQIARKGTDAQKSQAEKVLRSIGRIQEGQGKGGLDYLRRAFGRGAGAGGGMPATAYTGPGIVSGWRQAMGAGKGARAGALKDYLSNVAGGVGTAAAGRGKALSSSMKINRILKALPPELIKPSRLPWVLAPLGVGAGYLLDRYIKGEY